MKRTDFEKIYLLNSYNIRDYTPDVWDSISNAMTECVGNILTGHQLSLLRYPGFFIDKELAIKAYEKYVLDKFYKKNIINMPRGNLSSSLTHIMVGQLPFHNFAETNIKACPNFLCGSSSELLIKLLNNNNIYPYMTHVFKTNIDFKNNMIKPFIDEIDVIAQIAFSVYGIKTLKLVFVGNYDIYYACSTELKMRRIISKHNVNIQLYRIWHPIYLLKEYTEEKFKTWNSQLKNLKNRM